MGKSKVFENKAFSQPNAPGIGFNLVTQTNNFDSIFATKPLDKTESNQIEKLLVDNFQLGNLTENQVEGDAQNLKQITAEIKAIGKQGIILIGERVHRACEMLKSYKDGTFTRWLDLTFGARKTGYNMLNYYNLYLELPEDLRQKLKSIPQRAAYILASRKAVNSAAKAEIIRNYHDRSHKELIILIQDKFPLESQDKRLRKSLNEKLIETAREAITKLQVRKSHLTADDKIDLAAIIKTIQSILNVPALPSTHQPEDVLNIKTK